MSIQKIQDCYNNASLIEDVYRKNEVLASIQKEWSEKSLLDSDLYQDLMELAKNESYDTNLRIIVFEALSTSRSKLEYVDLVEKFITSSNKEIAFLGLSCVALVPKAHRNYFKKYVVKLSESYDISTKLEAKACIELNNW